MIAEPTLKDFWKHIAEEQAREANQDRHESRWGTVILELTGRRGERRGKRLIAVLCLFNNHPYSGDPGARDVETNRLREWLRTVGIEELAYAVYPEGGDYPGYSYAMLLRPSDRYTSGAAATGELGTQIAEIDVMSKLLSVMEEDVAHAFADLRQRTVMELMERQFRK